MMPFAPVSFETNNNNSNSNTTQKPKQSTSDNEKEDSDKEDYLESMILNSNRISHRTPIKIKLTDSNSLGFNSQGYSYKHVYTFFLRY